MTTTLLEKHPDYTDFIERWTIARDTHEGEQQIKLKNTTYLTKPSGFSTMADGGIAAYAAYMCRANFPDVMALTVRRLGGLMHRKPARYELPEALSHMFERATLDGLTLEGLHMRITRELLITGRYGLLPDLPVGGGDAYIAGYETERLVNWGQRREVLEFVMIDETDDDFDDESLAWDEKHKSRLLRLTAGEYTVTLQESGVDQATITPQKAGGGALDAIPFVFIDSTDLTPEPEDIPLIGLARTALSIYRLDADYRHQLFNSGQEFNVFIGMDKDDVPAVVGAGVNVAVPMGGDAKTVGPTGTGIEAHRVAMKDEFERAVTQGAQLLQEQKTAESGDAIRLRMSASTSALTILAKSAAAGLELALKNLAAWVGADPDEVVVDPNLDFVEAGLDPEQLEALVASWLKGAISGKTLHAKLQQQEVIPADRTEEDERKLIADVEKQLGPQAPTALKPDATVITALIAAFNAGLAPPETIISYFRATKLVPDDMTDDQLLLKALGLAELPDDADLGNDQIEDDPAFPRQEDDGGDPPQPNSGT